MMRARSPGSPHLFMDDELLSSASWSSAVVSIRPSRRSWAKSSTAIGRGRNGRCGRGARAKRWTWAIAAPAARSSPDDLLAGHMLVPATTVSRVAGTPASRPSRSVPSRRGAGKPYFSVTATAAAFVATWSGQTRLLGVRSTTADGESSGDLRFIHHGLSPSCRERMAVTVTRPPTCACIHASVCSVRPGPL
jgi:hypothetical protein